MGYYGFAGHQGQGLMREGLRAVLKVAFGEMGLHRLEANIQPDNHASIGLVRGAGFQCEGFSPKPEDWRTLARPPALGDPGAPVTLGLCPVYRCHGDRDRKPWRAAAADDAAAAARRRSRVRTPV